MKRHILTDADGVLVWWTKGFNEFMNSKGFIPLPDTDHEYKMSVRYDIPSELAIQMVKEFNTGPLIAKLDPFADAPHWVSLLGEEGFRFTVITSLSKDPHAAQHRADNLHDLFGDVFDDIICLDTGASKSEVLKKWEGSGYFWIEDHYYNALAGQKLGLKSVLIQHPYVIQHPVDIPTVSITTPWQEIYNMVHDHYDN